MPNALLLWLTRKDEAAAIAKEGHLSADFDLPVQVWFQEPICRLARNLHGFFHSRIQAQKKSDASGYPTLHSKRDFQEFVGYFAQTIREFESPGGKLLPTGMIKDPEQQVLDREDQHIPQEDVKEQTLSRKMWIFLLIRVEVEGEEPFQYFDDTMDIDIGG